MNAKQLVFHIGLHKTGTSYLQRSVFPKLFSDQNYLFGKSAEHALTMRDFDMSQPHVLSSERWSGDVLQPHNSWANFARFCTQVSMLGDVKAKVILVLRPHEEWLWSAYLQRIKFGGSFVSFRDYIEGFGDKGLSWAERVNALEGHDLLLLDYRELTLSPFSFISRIADFAGVPMLDALPSNKANWRNITPKHTLSLIAANKVSRTIHISNHVSSIFLRTRMISSNQEHNIRDSIIRFVERLAPRNGEISPPSLPQRLKDQLYRDWVRSWEIAAPSL